MPLPVPYDEANVRGQQLVYECEFLSETDPARRQELLVAVTRALCVTLGDQSTREVMPEAEGLFMIMRGVAQILAGDPSDAFQARECIKFGVSFLPFVLKPAPVDDPI